MFFKVSVNWHSKDMIYEPRFNNLWSCIQFPIQKQARPEGVNMKYWEWQLVNNQIENSNKNILERFYPSDTLYVDESFRRGYGLGGDWC